jgi:hypothetical protein
MCGTVEESSCQDPIRRRPAEPSGGSLIRGEGKSKHLWCICICGCRLAGLQACRLAGLQACRLAAVMGGRLLPLRLAPPQTLGSSSGCSRPTRKRAWESSLTWHLGPGPSGLRVLLVGVMCATTLPVSRTQLPHCLSVRFALSRYIRVATSPSLDDPVRLSLSLHLTRLCLQVKLLCT